MIDRAYPHAFAVPERKVSICWLSNFCNYNEIPPRQMGGGYNYMVIYLVSFVWHSHLTKEPPVLCHVRSSLLAGNVRPNQSMAKKRIASQWHQSR